MTSEPTTPSSPPTSPSGTLAHPPQRRTGIAGPEPAAGPGRNAPAGDSTAAPRPA